MWKTFFKKKLKRCSRTLPSRLRYLTVRELARKVITERVSELAPLCGVTPKRLAIRDQRRRWGSCSSLGNLNFNYRLYYLPHCLRDYVIVHELCHLKELHHGPAFWTEVEQVYPSFLSAVKELRELERMSQLNIAFLQAYQQAHYCEYCHQYRGARW